MCGIAGYLGPTQLDQKRLEDTLPLMHRRGPDSKGLFTHTHQSQACALLFSRLSIIDLEERSNQPYVLGDLRLVFNGEIYNYRELKTSLEKKGHRFETESDTEVLIRSYQEYGTKCVEDFEGMWAFAIYNVTDGSLFLSRDRFGEKPLFVHQNPQGFFFGSEIKLIKSLSGKNLTPNYAQINRFLTAGYRSLYKRNETFFAEVHEVLPGHNMFLRPGEPPREGRYWMPQYRPQTMSLENAIEGVRERLLESVRLRLRADVPLAFCLSGGVDSSAITSIAAKFFNSQVATFSIIDTDERYDESQNINATSKDIHSQHHSVVLKKSENLDGLRSLVQYHDAPVYTISYYIHSFLSRAISERGYRVAFSGTGADELLTGYYDHFHMHLYEMHGHDLFPTLLNDWKEGIGRHVRNPFLKDPLIFIKDRQFRKHVYNDPEEFREFLIDPSLEGFFETGYTESLLRNRMMNELFHEGTRLILHEDDLNSMYYSVENRSPYLDRQLFDFCFSIPPEHLIKNGYGKYLLREATKGILNDQVRLDRQKKGFNASIFSIIDFNSKSVRDELLAPSPVFDIIRRDRIEDLFSRSHLENSGSKFVFSFVSTKLFLESVI